MNLQARAQQAIEIDRKIHTQPVDHNYYETQAKRAKLNRIGVVRTAVNLLDEAIKSFSKEEAMFDTELRIETHDRFMRVTSDPMVKEIMYLGAQRISAFNPKTGQQHDGRWDAYDADIILQMCRASIIHYHKTDDERTAEHLKRIIKQERLREFKYPLDDELDTKEDDALLKEERERLVEIKKHEDERKKQREYNRKLEEAIALKERRDAEEELLAWLEKQPKSKRSA